MQKLQKLLSKIVGFQDDTVEDIDWKRIGQQLKWMNSFSKGYRGRLGVLVGFSIFFMLIGIAYTFVYKGVVDFFTARVQTIIEEVTTAVQQIRGTSLLEKLKFAYDLLPDWFIWVIVVYIAYKIISYCYSLFMQFFTLRLAMDLGLGIKRKVYAAIMESDWLSLTQYRAGDLVQRVSGDADTAASFAMETVPSMITQIVQFFVALAALIYLDWRLTLLAFITVPMSLFVIKLKGKRQRDYNKRSLELASKGSSFLYESMANIMVVKSFMLVKEFIARYRALHEEQYALTIEKTKYGIVTGLIIGMVSRVISIGVTLFFVVNLIDGRFTFGTLTAYTMLANQVSGPLSSIMGFIMGAIEMSASAERVMTLFELPRDRTQDPAIVETFAKKAGPDGMGVEINDLSFSYVEGETVLRDVNIDVNPGETVAFVGPSGEGKTTLIRLALGLLTPDSGAAYLKTSNEEKLDLSVETRAFFSYVPQGNTMFSGTIRENMEMGREGASDEEMVAALKQACIWSFVETLPEGLDSKIGERGVGVSEGQAQRLAIARALLRGAPILLLDEATSALDIYTEKEVLDNVFATGVVKTCILTTHRPSVFTVCDKIYRVRQRTVELIKSSRDQEVEF